MDKRPDTEMSALPSHRRNDVTRPRSVLYVNPGLIRERRIPRIFLSTHLVQNRTVRSGWDASRDGTTDERRHEKVSCPAGDTQGHGRFTSLPAVFQTRFLLFCLLRPFWDGSVPCSKQVWVESYSFIHVRRTQRAGAEDGRLFTESDVRI